MEQDQNTQRDLLIKLRAGEVDPVELEQVLLAHYSHGSHLGEESTFGKQQGPIALRLIYDKNWKPTALLTGPAFVDADEEALRTKIAAQLLAPGEEQIGRKVLFSLAPTTGWFRYRDWFQLVPVPPEAPRPDHIYAKHPFLLEVRFLSSPDVMVSARRRAKAEREVELLCGALINFPIESIASSATHRWVLKPGEAQPTSFLAQELYTWQSPNIWSKSFTNTERVPAIRAVEPQAHYTRHGIGPGDVFEIPADLSELIDTYRQLDESDREGFSRAAYWLQHAEQVWLMSRSASFAAFVRAIEAIMPPEKGQQRCPTCKQLQGKSKTDQFAAFVDGLVKKAVPEEDRKRFYRTRSALVHGGKLLHQDQAMFGFSPQGWGEYRELSSLSQIVQIALRNWLAAHDHKNVLSG